ncbi:MAG: NYN domain-containing protein [Acidimicrobiales bacterium]
MVVDGSNLATEGRNTPSLAQLDEAVRSFHSERPDDEIIVVVDASFGYRIDESERKMFEEAEEAGEIVSPPAGAIGRGDGFLLRIADRINADVLSNDSFQEFHGEYLWLFEEGRLVGGKPVPGVGWIFTPRTPVRGPKSRVATRDADRARKRTAAAVARPEPTSEAIAEATAEAIAPDAPKAAKRGSRRRGRSAAETGTPEAVNEPLPFITFIADHPLGTEVEGTVEGFTSHGAFVTAGGARCYAPVSGLGDPPPRSAKEVLTRGEVRSFVIQALDPPRRGIELALPGLAKVAGAPTEETVEAEIDVGAQPVDVPVEVDIDAEPAPAPRRRGRKAAPVAVEPEPEAEPAVEAPPPPKARRSRKAAAPPEPVPEAAAPPEPVPEPAPARPARPRRSTSRTGSGPEQLELEPKPVRRSRKKAAAPVVEEAPPPVVEEPVKKATRSRKKVAAVLAEEPVTVEELPKKATRSRKKAVAAAEEAPPAPVKKAVAKKAVPKKAAKKAAPTGE